MYKGTYLATTQCCPGQRAAQVTPDSPTEPPLYLFATEPDRHRLGARGWGERCGGGRGGGGESLARRRAGREGATEPPPPRARPCGAQAAPRQRCRTRGLGRSRPARRGCGRLAGAPSPGLADAAFADDEDLEGGQHVLVHAGSAPGPAPTARRSVHSCGGGAAPARGPPAVCLQRAGQAGRCARARGCCTLRARAVTWGGVWGGLSGVCRCCRCCRCQDPGPRGEKRPEKMATGCYTLEWAARGGGGVPASGGVSGKTGRGMLCYGVVDKAVIDHRLESMSSEVFSSLTDPVISCAARRQPASARCRSRASCRLPPGAAGPEPAIKTWARLGTNQHWRPAGTWHHVISCQPLLH